MSRTRMAQWIVGVMMLGVLVGLSLAAPVAAQGPQRDAAAQRADFAADNQPPADVGVMGATPCQSGMAGPYPCSNVDLMAHLPLTAFSASEGSSLWGWTDTSTGREYALMGTDNGTAFVDITNAANPTYLGKLPSHTGSSSWRELKVHNNHVYVVSDANGAHGIQIFNLTRLRDVVNPPVTFTEDGHYAGVGSAHNMVINEASGRGYAVGASSCNGGLHAISLANPTAPTFLGCYSADGYSHDAQCVTYSGPDVTHQGKEICVGSNEDTVTVVDMTNAAAPVQLSRTSYAGVGYTHQSWFTEDQRYMVVDDEFDELDDGHNARTYIWNMADLDAPVMIGFYTSSAPSIDHNQYIKGQYDFQANYRAGMRVLDISNIANASLTEIGFFDIYPADNAPGFNGAWNVFPYFPSGNVIVSGIEQGLFVLRPTNLAPTAVTVGDLGGTPAPLWPLAAGAAGLVALMGAVALRRR